MLYLNHNTFVGKDGDQLAEEVRAAAKHLRPVFDAYQIAQVGPLPGAPQAPQVQGALCDVVEEDEGEPGG